MPCSAKAGGGTFDLCEPWGRPSSPSPLTVCSPYRRRPTARLFLDATTTDWLLLYAVLVVGMLVWVTTGGCLMLPPRMEDA